MAQFLYEDKTVYYEVYGTGKPIIILNGIMMSCHSWMEFIEPFSESNQLILFDLFDQGRSSRLTREECTQDLQVELVHAVLKHLKIEKVCVVGISYGGEIGLKFALKYLDMVDRLILFNTTSRTGPWLKDIGDSWILAAYDPAAYYLTTIPIIYSSEFYRKNNTWLNQRRELLKTVFSDKEWLSAMERLTNSSAEYDVSELLDRIVVPTLVVSCLQDHLTPIEEQQLMASKLPNCQYVMIPDCGHASMYEKPALFTTLVLGFVNNSKLVFNIK